MNLKVFVEIVLMFLIPFIIIIIPIYLGERTGRYAIRKHEKLKDVEVSTVMTASFGLLGFMLGFTFQIAAERFEKRKDLLLDEVTNIRTTYLRAKLLPDPVSSECKALLTEYVDIRVDLANDPSKLNGAKSRSQEILAGLWKVAVTLSEETRSSEIYALFTESVNDLYDNYNQRITLTFEYRVPSMVIWVLLIIAFFTMFILGLQLGITKKRGIFVNLLLAVVFAIVILLILSLNRPQTGMIKMNQKPLITLQEQLKTL